MYDGEVNLIENVLNVKKNIFFDNLPFRHPDACKAIPMDLLFFKLVAVTFLAFVYSYATELILAFPCVESVERNTVSVPSSQHNQEEETLSRTSEAIEPMKLCLAWPWLTPRTLKIEKKDK
uniref:Uncharacterized protein n=1 Tax=Glossina austeni TaxID=7395 RepID=A0A1A9UWM8_GLOAU